MNVLSLSDMIAPEGLEHDVIEECLHGAFTEVYPGSGGAISCDLTAAKVVSTDALRLIETALRAALYSEVAEDAGHSAETIAEALGVHDWLHLHLSSVE